ncbi:MAG: hypothetical protein RL368_1779 [Pseudomonadota bacterium]|jgi:CRISPR-associated protein (TIGR03986 family)
MPEFHHPYNFIPVTGKVNGEPTPKVLYEKIAEGYKGIRHDLWEKNTQSGRIVARVHLKTPTMVGGQQEKRDDNSQEPSEVLPFERDGKTALPANSLRGVIGSVAETLSQSSLRVLEKRRYSVRKPVENGLSAIGILRENKNNPSQFEILPLTVPHHLNEQWRNVFGGTTPLKYRLVAPVLGYQKANGKTDAPLGFIPDSYLDKHPSLQSFHDVDHQEYFYGKLTKPEKETLRSEQKKLLLGQPISEILTVDEYKSLCKSKKLHPSELKNYVRGFLRILGIEGREESMPKTKKQEFFIPYPINTVTPIAKIPKAIPIPTAVIENFCTLAKERHDEDENLPFLPKGYESWQPKSGQLVFFDICENAGKIEVSEISFSSIWRKLIKGESHEFFSQIDPDLLPWNPLRDSLTPAECLFGVVEDGKNKETKQARALASRVRFHDAVSTKQVKPENPVKPELVTLKILSSPKPPSPAMYFHPSDPKQERHIKKIDLTLGQHRPNGRKVYLHHAATDIQEKPWITANGDNLKQKVRCQPIAAGENFYFHVDFDNLSEAELNLLIHSLYPSDAFQHRLGLGKALGLGSVKIDIMGVFLINRAERYSLEGFYETARYHQTLRGTIESTEWGVLYPTEFEALKTATELKSSDFYADKSLIDKTSLNLLNTVGNPAKLQNGVSVKPPLTNEHVREKKEEEETFQWFGKNENLPNHQNSQALRPIEADQALPTLRTN